MPAAVATAAAPAKAEAEKDKKRLGATWVVTRGAKVVGEEKLKLVVKKDGRRFLSVVFKPTKLSKKAKKAGKGPFKQTAVLWRDGAGQLTKYVRVQDRRLGQGVRVFRRGKHAKIVGINARKDMASLKLTDQVILDGNIWGAAWDWLPRLRGKAGQLTVSYIDVLKRIAGKAQVTRGEAIAVTNKKGTAGIVTPWTIGGTSIKGLTFYLDSKRRLVGARSESRAMLLKGWSWDAPPVDPAIEAPPGSEEAVAPPAAKVTP